MKKLFSIILILGLLLCSVGCQSSNDPVYAMRRAYLEQFYSDHEKFNVTEDMVKIWVYGTCDGCTVGYFGSNNGGLFVIDGEKVGSFYFRYPSSTKMLAYKDGVFKSMSEAYELGWLDDEAVANIYDNFINDCYTLYE